MTSRNAEPAAKVLGPQWLKLPLLTTGMLGLQIVWSLEMAYASPYLLQLGLSSSLMSLVFIAGPLSGLLVQPIVGVMSDRCTLTLGRRRPFIIAGTVVCVFGMALLGFTRQFANIFCTAFSPTNNILTIILATISIFIIDFSINAVQAMDRAIIVDTLPPESQELGNAWASRMIGVGHVIGFFLGNISLKAFPFLSVFGETQLQIFSVITSIILVLAHLVTISTVRERRQIAHGHEGKSTVRKAASDIWKCLVQLPPTIHQIFAVQFFSWLSWFPVLFFSSVYVGELYKAIRADSTGPRDDEATLHGARAMFFNSILALFTSIVAPWFVSKEAVGSGVKSRFRLHLASLWALGHLVFGLSMGMTFLRPDWKIGTAMIAITGFSFTITEWAPFALIAQIILEKPTTAVYPATDDTRGLLSTDDDQADTRLVYYGTGDGPSVTPEVSRDGKSAPGIDSRVGLVLGIHNVFIVLPQFVMTAISSIVFAILDPQRAVNDPSRDPSKDQSGGSTFSLVVIYRIAGLSAMVAFVLSCRLSKRLQRGS